jgi:hypothetical protein
MYAKAVRRTLMKLTLGREHTFGSPKLVEIGLPNFVFATLCVQTTKCWEPLLFTVLARKRCQTVRAWLFLTTSRFAKVHKMRHSSLWRLSDSLSERDNVIIFNRKDIVIIFSIVPWNKSCTQCISGIWTSLNWLNLIMGVWF